MQTRRSFLLAPALFVASAVLFAACPVYSGRGPRRSTRIRRAPRRSYRRR